MMAALDPFGQTHLHVVAQVIETKFVIGTIEYIGIVGKFAVDHLELVLIFMRGRFPLVNHKGFLPVFCPGGHLQNPDT